MASEIPNFNWKIVALIAGLVLANFIPTVYGASPNEWNAATVLMVLAFTLWGMGWLLWVVSTVPGKKTERKTTRATKHAAHTEQNRPRPTIVTPPPPKPKVRTHYEVLGLNPNAELEVIKAAYKALCKKYHPDNLNTGDLEESKLLNIAFEVLSDPGKKSRYDLDQKLRSQK